LVLLLLLLSAAEDAGLPSSLASLDSLSSLESLDSPERAARDNLDLRDPESIKLL